MYLDEDNTWIDGLKKGNEEAYKHLYNLYYRPLVIYCSNLTGDFARAQDIVQNTFMKIWIKRKNIVISSSLKSYLYRAVFNEFATEYGKRKREEELLVQIKNKVLEDIIDLDNELVEEKIMLIEKAIEQLPEKCKKVFLLNKKQGYRYKEIAAQLNISENTVEKHISRAIRRIKELVHKNNTIRFLLFIYSKTFISLSGGETNDLQTQQESAL